MTACGRSGARPLAGSGPQLPLPKLGGAPHPSPPSSCHHELLLPSLLTPTDSLDGPLARPRTAPAACNPLEFLRCRAAGKGQCGAATARPAPDSTLPCAGNLLAGPTGVGRSHRERRTVAGTRLGSLEGQATACHDSSESPRAPSLGSIESPPSRQASSNSEESAKSRAGSKRAGTKRSSGSKRSSASESMLEDLQLRALRALVESVMATDACAQDTPSDDTRAKNLAIMTSVSTVGARAARTRLRRLSTAASKEHGMPAADCKGPDVAKDRLALSPAQRTMRSSSTQGFGSPVRRSTTKSTLPDDPTPEDRSAGGADARCAEPRRRSAAGSAVGVVLALVGGLLHPDNTAVFRGSPDELREEAREVVCCSAAADLADDPVALVVMALRVMGPRRGISFESLVPQVLFWHRRALSAMALEPGVGKAVEDVSWVGEAAPFAAAETRNEGSRRADGDVVEEVRQLFAEATVGTGGRLSSRHWIRFLRCVQEDALLSSCVPAAFFDTARRSEGHHGLSFGKLRALLMNLAEDMRVHPHSVFGAIARSRAGACAQDYEDQTLA